MGGYEVIWVVEALDVCMFRLYLQSVVVGKGSALKLLLQHWDYEERINRSPSKKKVEATCLGREDIITMVIARTKR